MHQLVKRLTEATTLSQMENLLDSLDFLAEAHPAIDALASFKESLQSLSADQIRQIVQKVAATDFHTLLKHRQLDQEGTDAQQKLVVRHSRCQALDGALNRQLLPQQGVGMTIEQKANALLAEDEQLNQSFLTPYAERVRLLSDLKTKLTNDIIPLFKAKLAKLPVPNEPALPLEIDGMVFAPINETVQRREYATVLGSPDAGKESMSVYGLLNYINDELYSLEVTAVPVQQQERAPLVAGAIEAIDAPVLQPRRAAGPSKLTIDQSHPIYQLSQTLTKTMDELKVLRKKRDLQDRGFFDKLMKTLRHFVKSLSFGLMKGTLTKASTNMHRIFNVVPASQPAPADANDHALRPPR